MSSFKLAQVAKVENYDPEKIVAPSSPHARAFMGEETKTSDDFFELNPEISHFMGITKAKKQEEQRRFDAEVLKYVQGIKDDAYREAYELGLKNGAEEAKKEAFSQAQEEIQQAIKSFLVLSEKVQTMSQKMFSEREKDMIDLSYLIAEKIVHQALERQPELFTSIIKSVIKKYPTTLIQLSEKDYNFLKQHPSEHIEFESLNIEPNKELKSGDVVFSNEVGILDGTVSSRLEIMKQVVLGEN